MAANNYPSLQHLLDATPDLVGYFHNDTLSPHSIGRPGTVPVPLEITNWRDEQRAWRESVLLFDQSHHMPETFLGGPDAEKLLSHLGINSFAKFAPLRAKQYVCCNHDGFVIGECVLQLLPDGTYELMSGMYVQNWLQFHAETGRYDVTLERDPPTGHGSGGRKMYHFQLEGPLARDLFAEAIEGEMPDIPFFRMATARIAGCDVYILRHGMAGHLGVEISGPFAEGEKVRAHLMAIGEKYGIRHSGVKTQYSALGESGWLGYPIPAVYTDPALADFRKWLPGDCWEAQSQLGGSLVTPDIADYYVTPWDLNLDKLLKFDHDFIGREALERMATRTDHRRKVTLVWNPEDILKVQGSLLEPGIPCKYFEMPKSSYAFQQYDEVRDTSGERVGFSNFVGYTVNEAKFLSVAVVDARCAAPGTEVLVTWGEPDGGSRKPVVERHRQSTIRATVAPNPYARSAQQHKNAGLINA
ncbi:aminomethyltransferase family protein [Croceicoccus mobilis]|uniref:Glycine cleavage system protein T n=1 Tax=Croceicoccus mobilis TaxID=1703339 RepID=A0A916Z5D8_9SPHN|nr:aminomethyltransferase family protein [Croceicoccus mobilis]GGD77112.1 glycine cleavage system protein T [Croceicoccus mobilis]